MGDLRAGTSGTTATALTPSPGKRIARHSAERPAPQPYAGRRVAPPAPDSPVAEPPVAESLPYAGRRVAGRNPVLTVPVVAPVVAPVIAPVIAPVVIPVSPPAEVTGVVGRRIAAVPAPTGEPDDVVGHLLGPTAAPSLESYVGRRIRTVPLIVEPAASRCDASETVDVTSLLAAEPLLEVAAPVADPPVIDLVIDPVIRVEPVDAMQPLVIEPDIRVEPVVAVEPPAIEPDIRVEPVVQVEPEPAGTVTPSRPAGRRAAARRTRVPSLPLLAGIAVLAISAGGALQNVQPGLAGADATGRISPAGALSGSSGVGSASLLGGRAAVVSRDSARTLSAGNLQAFADAQAKQRDAALSASLQQAEKQSAQIKLHQWVLPIPPGVYHLTARFGDYSSLWSHFHTGLDFAAPTGTPIMAVAGGTITETGYSGAYGNRTIEALPDGTELWYCHQNAFGTSVGATVKPGQVIGYVGSTGNVTGPHLHLEVHPGGGDPVDPYAALVAHGLYPGPPA